MEEAEVFAVAIELKLMPSVEVYIVISLTELDADLP